MKALLLATALAVLLPVGGYAQTADELKKGSADTRNVLNYGLDYGQKRYSPLDQINKETVARLVPA